MQNKTIVFISGLLKNGGVAKRISVISKELSKKGYSIIFLLMHAIDDDVYFDYGDGTELISLSEYIKKNKLDEECKKNETRINRKISISKKKSYFRKLFCPNQCEYERFRHTKLRKTTELRTFLLHKKPDLLIPFGIDYYTLAYFAAEGLNCKIIFAERNSPTVENGNSVKEKCNRKCLSHADWAVFQTKEEYKYYEKQLAGKASVIHNPVSTELPEKFEGKRKHDIVNFCRIAEQKDLPLLIDAFILFLTSHPDYRLLIYGNTVCDSELELKEQLEKYVKEKGMEKKILILPPRADVHELVRDCAMFVSSSDFEGLSNSMIEALAIGLPCICTDCLGGGARECIENEKSGLLTPIGDRAALCNAMCRFADSPEFAEKCACEGYKIKQRLSAGTICEKWHEVIEGVLEK